MCRVAAFPPGFSREEALEILANFENRNTDGTGCAFIKDGKLVVNKWAKPFSSVVRPKAFLSHMPHDGWTIAHLRAASHGDNLKQNTHPFVVGPWAFIHNGIWSEYNLVRLALSKQVKMEGDTDSEVAAHLWNIVGPKRFAEAIEFGGVFIGLHTNGELWAVKTNGDLEIKALRGERVLLASEFDYSKYPNTVDAVNGWYHFNKEGKYLKHKQTSESLNNYSSYGESCISYRGRSGNQRSAYLGDTGYVPDDYRHDARYFSNHHISGD